MRVTIGRTTKDEDKRFALARVVGSVRTVPPNLVFARPSTRQVSGSGKAVIYLEGLRQIRRR